ncbi:MAG: TolC family protein [Kangiellaceae bacterium]|nr:TolC family protein [Kangiellaceae bacterium]
MKTSVSISKAKINTRRGLTLASLIIFTASCVTVGPDYKRPEIRTPNAFKEANKESSKDNVNEVEQKTEVANITASWWHVYNDPILDNLLRQIEVKNYSLQAAAAQVEQARASVTIAKSGQSPALVAGGVNDFGVLLSWEIDLWGKIKRNTESSKAAAQASIADLAAAKLSLQAQLAQNYFLLRIKDADIQLSKETSKAYQRALEISKNQYAAGVVGRENLTQAQAQISSVQVEIFKAKIRRAKLEHSIAVLIGLAPADFQLEAASINSKLPTIPVSLPSQLLSRRPDIAAAERRMAAANAQIGVAKSRAYPSLSLSSGYRLVKNFVGGSRVTLPLYTSGAVSANSKKAAFAYNATVAD